MGYYAPAGRTGKSFGCHDKGVPKVYDVVTTEGRIVDGSNWRWGPNDAPKDDPYRPPPSAADDGPSGLVILVVAALLVTSSLFLVHRIGDMVQIQTCALQGRTNCAPIK
jgi:hypothetical protein